MSYRNEPGGSRRRQIVGTPIHTPKHGDTLPDERAASTSQPRRLVPKPQVSGTIGRDTLHQERSPLTGKNEGSRTGISSDSFYGRSSFSNGVATRSAVQRSTPTSSFSRPNTLRMVTSPTDTHTPQYRNASRGKRPQSGVSRGGEPVIISDSEEEVEETNAPQPGSIRLAAPTHREQPKKAQQRGGSSDVEAAKDRVQHGSNGDGIGKEVGRKFPLPELNPLAPGRTFPIATEYDQPATRGTDLEAVPRVRQADRMRNKDGKTRLELGQGKSGKRQQLGNTIRTSIPQSARRALASPPREKREIATESSIPERKHRLDLKSAIFLDIGQIAETAEPYVIWTESADLRVVWRESGKTMSVTIPAGDIAECGICESINFPYVSLNITTEIKIKAALAEQIGPAFKKYEQSKSTGMIHLVAPRKTDETFRRPAWDALHEVLEENGIAININVQNSEFFISGFMGEMPHLERRVEGRLKAASPSHSSNSSGDKSLSASASARTSVAPLRVSQRQRGKGTESEEEEKAIEESVERAIKERGSSDPSRPRLRYPFDEAGGVTAFQSDLDKLNEREMLNDTIIEIGLKYLLKQIQERDPELYDQIYVFSSFFYKRISESKRDRKTAYQYVKKWTKKVDIFEKKYLVIPINEKMHWYLAILTNPAYAIRQEREEEGEGLARKEAESGATKVLNDESNIDLDGQGDQPDEGALDAHGDTIMSTSGKDKEAEAEINDFSSSASSSSVFQNPSPEQLAQSYSNSANKLRRISVADTRRRNEEAAMTQSTADDSSEDISFVSAIKSSPVVRSRQGRPGVGDGITRGSLVGGGGGQPVVIVPGESFRDMDDEEEVSESSSRVLAAAEKPKSGIEDTLRSPLGPGSPSPPRSRSGATYTRANVATQNTAREETQDKYRRWLQDSAVVCLFDSLNGKHRAVTTALKDYLYLEYNDKKGGELEAKDVVLEHIDVDFPSQGNFCDCGLYLLHAFERFFADPDLMVREVIASRGSLHKHWQEEEAAKKREWWRNRLTSLAEEWEANYQPKKRKRSAVMGEEGRKIGEKERQGNEERDTEGEESQSSDDITSDQRSGSAADSTAKTRGDGNGNGDSMAVDSAAGEA